MLKIACISIGYPNFRYDIAQVNLDESLKYLNTLDNVEIYSSKKVLINEDDILNELDVLSKFQPHLFILQLGTYSYGSALLMYLEKIKGAHLLLWAFREPIIENFNGLPLNSLCALNMYISFLHRMNNKDFSFIYGDTQEEQVLNKLSATIEAAKIKMKLRNSKFCVVGGRVPGFYLSNVDEVQFMQHIGPQIEHYSIASLINDANSISDDLIPKEVFHFKNMVSICNADESSLEKSARLYLALLNYVKKNNIQGFAIKCWPDFQEVYNIAVCGVISRLNEEGICASCEGDITGLTTIFIQKQITKQAVFLTDLVNITENGIVKIWHCGCASPSLANSKSDTMFSSHPTMKNIKGLSSMLTLKPGHVTMCKLSEAKPYKMLIASGECIAPDRQVTGNQGDIKFDFDTNKFLELIVNEGIEHHYGIAYDCNVEVLKQLCSMLNINVLTLNDDRG